MGNAPAACCKCEEGDSEPVEIVAANEANWSAIKIGAPPKEGSKGGPRDGMDTSPRSTPRNSPKGSPTFLSAPPPHHATSGSLESEAGTSGRLAVPVAGGLPKSSSSLSRGTTHTSDHSGASKMSKLQRLNSLGHLHVDKELLCGLTIRKSLRNGGRSWMRMPKDMNEAELIALHSKVEAMESFDFFLSHTWSTHGKWKVLSLLMQTGWPYALLCGSLAVTATMVLCLFDYLPLSWSFDGETSEGPGTYPLGCWISCASLVGLLVGLLISPYCPCLDGRPGDCFIDMVSIDQSDPQKIEDGIYGIGGFLNVARELQVLWSPPYLSRLWCVFELAAYRKANPTGKITLTPLYVEQILVMLIFGLYAVLGFYWVVTALNLSNAVSLLVYFIAMIPAMLPLHRMRRSFAGSKHKMLADLKDFDIKNVKCMDDFDRSFIHSAIIKWYGSREAFTEFVRGPLRDELLKDSISSLTHFPFGYLLLLGFIPTAMGLEYMVSYWKAGLPVEWLASYMIGSVVSFDLIWTMLALRVALYCCDRLAARSPRCIDSLKTLSCWVCLSFWQVFGVVMQGIAIRTSLPVTIGWLGFTLLVAGISWCLSRRP